MPGVERLSISETVAEVTEIAAAGVRAVILFGIPASKDEFGTEAYDDEGVIQMAVRALKEAHPEVAGDHRRLPLRVHEPRPLRRLPRGLGRRSDNDLTVELLAKTAISHAEAGADAVAPSDMMDGRVGTIRHQLDEEGHSGTPIIAYSAKYSSAFYGPFREAAGSTPESGDRRGYQMDPGQRRGGRARGPARPRGGRRRADGEARAPVPRRRPPGQGRDRRPRRRVPRLRRVLDAEGRRGQRLARRAAPRRWSR